MPSLRRWVHKYMKIFLSLWRVIEIDPESTSLNDLTFGNVHVKPYLWPYRIIGSPWWYVTQTSFALQIVNLALFLLTNLWPGLRDILYLCGLIDLSVALLPSYRGLFSVNYINVLCFGFMDNFILLRHSRQNEQKTFFSVILNAGQLEELRQESGLYSEVQRLRLWRLTLVVHYCVLLMWLMKN